MLYVISLIPEPPADSIVEISNKTEHKVSNLRAFLTKGNLEINESPELVISGLHSGETILMAEFSSIESNETKEASFEAEIPFDGNTILVYENNLGDTEAIYADTDYLNAQTTKQFVKYTIK